MPDIGDVVLVYYHDNPAVYGRIEAIEPDIKPGWYQVTLLLLTIPSQTVTWILRREYINGEPFTMGGNPMRLEEVKRRVDPEQATELKRDKKGPGGPARIIPFKKPQ
ncbi:MAG TPA: hypothetical protein EYP06_06910 [Desulfobacterales bacterium]|nr:hypothetical protein [Desulfobacterales bacterium]